MNVLKTFYLEGDMISLEPSILSGEDDTVSCPSVSCEMCANYEFQLTKMQESERDLKEQLTAAQELSDRYEKELSGERLYRKELESKLSTLNAETERKVRKCLELSSGLEERMGLLAEKQQSDMGTMQKELEMAQKKYTELQNDLITLNEKYQKLLGLNREKAAEMRELNIELPQTVDQLQFMALQLREELIETRAAREHEVCELRDDLAVAREQLLEMEISQNETEDLLRSQQIAAATARNRRGSMTAAASVGANNQTQQSQNTASNSRHSPLNRYEFTAVDNDPQMQRQMIAELEVRLSHSLSERARLEGILSDYHQKCSTLKKELDTSETVQKDFVRLSQNLQIQLEKIRQGENEVRWQFEEDVANCNRCSNGFNGNKRSKLNCRHCGRIFCADCLSQTVFTGPSNRPAKVCDVCHTLLNRQSVPFFSNTRVGGGASPGGSSGSSNGESNNGM